MATIMIATIMILRGAVICLMLSFYLSAGYFIPANGLARFSAITGAIAVRPHRGIIYNHNFAILMHSTTIADTSPFSELDSALSRQGVTPESVAAMIGQLKAVGWSNCQELLVFAADFQSRPEVLSKLLREDFGFNPVESHKLRAALMLLLSGNASLAKRLDRDSRKFASAAEHLTMKNKTASSGRILFKQYVVNNRAAQSFLKTRGDRSYGIRTNESASSEEHLPQQQQQRIYEELEAFMQYMTELTPNSQEAPIRKATAEVYYRHAKLFLGWFVSTRALKEPANPQSENLVDLATCFPTKEKHGATSVFEFVKWLRQERRISDSYEANLIRGLTKLAKFRFSLESKSDPSYGEKSFEDIPVIRELRKLHRDANRRQKLSPRVSDEKKKWLAWQEYLQVVQCLKSDLMVELANWKCDDTGSKPKRIRKQQHAEPPLPTSPDPSYTPQQRRIADKFQKYLLLAFLATIPDRQRTFRELVLGTTFQRESLEDEKERDGCSHRYIIKHGPEDYKTGKTYGDRPPLIIASELTKSIDEFIEKWRPALQPKGPHLFTQLRTGNAMTQDSIYQHVARACYEHTGKRTNPHLLRDMIVTHVRSSTQASEKELEALALYMGHSIAMQRSSYDRRTLTQKVAPAVNLLESLSRSST